MHPRGKPEPSQNAELIRAFIARRAGLVLDATRRGHFFARMDQLFRELPKLTMASVVAAITADEHGPLATRLVELMLINETSFFRDSAAFELLREELVPRAMRARSSVRSLRVWCAAASSGQEPYSVAMLLREHFPELESWDVEILATDIHRDMVARGREGTYRSFELERGLPAGYASKYFEEIPARDRADPERRFRVIPALRRLVAFRTLNLVEPWPMREPIDIVLLRNVLVYFDATTKCRVLSRVRDHIHVEGSLLLGGGELAISNAMDFEPVRQGRTLHFRPRRRTMWRRPRPGVGVASSG